MVLIYLLAIVAANLITNWLGPIASIVNAFLLIGLDLTTRDTLHERWHGKQLWIKMFTLITIGSLLTWVVNRGAGNIALASLVAFFAAGIVDTLVYHLMRRKPKMWKVNISNVIASLVDSTIFPTIAFGKVMIYVTIGQFVAKVLGGFLWSLILTRRGKH